MVIKMAESRRLERRAKNTPGVQTLFGPTGRYSPAERVGFEPTMAFAKPD